MSVTCSVHVVPWEAFEQIMRKNADFLTIGERFPAESLLDDMDAHRLDFLERFDGLAPRWNRQTAWHFARVFGPLFWSWRDAAQRIVELPMELHDLPRELESAWSPQTVKRAAIDWRNVNLDECRAIYPENIGADLPFSRFEDFKSYAEAWGRTITRGAREGCGLLVCVWG